LQKLDKGNDNIFEAITKYSYDINDRLIDELFDGQNDGIFEKRTTYGYDHTQQTYKSVSDNGTAYIMKKYAQGSEDICKTINGKVVPVETGTSPYFNQKSILDLKTIKNKLKTQQLSADDLQFLIDFDGSIYIADSAKVSINTTPSKVNIDTIDFLIKAAGGIP
jgi:hypothetical protein